MKRAMEFFYSPTRATSVSAFGANDDTAATLLVNASPPGATISLHLTIVQAEELRDMINKALVWINNETKEETLA
tara:strand:+ start:446 stop:670 length:225 start_codon:yes stop_codon:yes gene_type:complete